MPRSDNGCHAHSLTIRQGDPSVRLAKISKFLHNLNDERFIHSLDETRQRLQWSGYFFLGFVNILYILVDRSLVPDLWTQWPFLGTRLLVSFSSWIFILHPVWRKSQAGLYVPGTILFFGMAAMTHAFPEEKLIETYSGIAMVFAAYTLITSVKLKYYLMYVTVIYASYYSIWLFNPPGSFADWMSKRGFANFTCLVLAAVGFYIFRMHLSFLNYKLMGKLNDRNLEIEKHRFRLENILKSLPQAVLLIDLSPDKQRLALTEGYSAALHALFGPDVGHGDDLIRSIFGACDLNDDQLSQIKSVLMSSLKENTLAWDMNRHALPISLNLKHASGLKNLQIDWAAVEERDGSVGKILVSIKDATELHFLHQGMFQQSVDSRRIIEIIAVEREKLRDFFALARSLMNESKQSLRVGSITAAAVHAVFRNMHTLKGLARAYNLNDMTQLTHQVENIVEQGDREAIPGGIEQILAVIQEYHQLFDRLYGSSQKTHEISVDQSQLEFLSNQILPAIMQSDASLARETLQALRRLYCFNLERILIDEVQMTRQIALKLDKMEPEISFIQDNYHVIDFLRTPLRKVFVHIFRNSIDHGIETVDQRLRAGKTPMGCIRISVDALAQGYKIYIEDDGQGLNLPKILERARSKEMLDGEHEYSKKEIAAFIFALGISTTDIGSELSGRGVGMDAVRTFLGGHDCAIEIELLGRSWRQDHERFRFVISVPKNYLMPIISETEELAFMQRLPAAS